MWKLIFFSKNNGDKFGAENPEIDLMNLLVEKTISAGHMLSFKEAKEDPEMVQPNNYAFYFGSFSEAAKIAWLRAKSSNINLGELTKQDCKLIKSPKDSHQAIEKSYGREVSHMGKTCNQRGKRYTTDDIKRLLVEFYDYNGRLPTVSDTADCDSKLPGWATLKKHLGPKSGWLAIVAEEKVVTHETEDVVNTDSAVFPTDDANLQSDESTSTEPKMSTDKVTLSCNNAEEVSEDCDRAPVDNINNDEEEVSCRGKDVQVETLRQKQDNLVAIEMKITLPDREKPILITLTV